MTAGGLWLAGLVIGIITTVITVRRYSDEATTRQQLELIQPVNDTLVVTMKNDIADADDVLAHRNFRLCMRLML